MYLYKHVSDLISLYVAFGQTLKSTTFQVFLHIYYYFQLFKCMKFVFQAPIQCCICAFSCTSEDCLQLVEYDPEEDGIHFWSDQTCMGDEIGYTFLNLMMSSSMTFSGFCDHMNSIYKSRDTNFSFVCKQTFIDWWYSWAAAFKFDFRKDADPWCKDHPKVLVGDGTHTGISLKHLDMTAIEAEEVNTNVRTVHIRYDRHFISEPDEAATMTKADLAAKRSELSSARSHLRKICEYHMFGKEYKLDCKHCIENHVYGTEHPMVCQEMQSKNQILVNNCKGDNTKSLVNILLNFHDRNLSQPFMNAIANFFLLLSCDVTPVSAVVPFKCLDDVERVIAMLENTADYNFITNQGLHTAPELEKLLEKAVVEEKEDECKFVFGFVKELVRRVREVHQRDPPTAEAEELPNTYQPARGVFYYFSQSGEQLRKIPHYIKNGRADENEQEACHKYYPKVGKYGFCYMFFWLCPLHGHCYGGHLIKENEGRKDPFSSLYKYMRDAPDVVFYDNSCQLSQYCLNREPAFFRGTRMYHDVFHGYSHKCGQAFKSRRIPSLQVNSEICEQFNSMLKGIRHIGSHMRQDHFMFLIQFVVHFWNKRKTKNFEEFERKCIGSLM